MTHADTQTDLLPATPEMDEWGGCSRAASCSDFTVALQREYDHVMVSLGMACRKSGGDLTDPDVVNLMAMADALDAVCKLWGVNPNNG